MFLHSLHKFKIFLNPKADIHLHNFFPFQYILLFLLVLDFAAVSDNEKLKLDLTTSQLVSHLSDMLSCKAAS